MDIVIFLGLNPDLHSLVDQSTTRQSDILEMNHVLLRRYSLVVILIYRYPDSLYRLLFIVIIAILILVMT